jgi:Skp family chaperone for outer membrane proteins
MKKIYLLIILFIFSFSNLFADNSHFIDFRKVLNFSKAGAQAQKDLKSKTESELKKFNKQEESIKSEERKIISEKKSITNEVFKERVNSLRKKNAELQDNKKKSFNNLAKSRDTARKTLLTKVNPIIKKYMEDNNIRIIVDKKSVVMGDSTLEITDQIITILNKEISSLKIN